MAQSAVFERCQVQVQINNNDYRKVDVPMLVAWNSLYTVSKNRPVPVQINNVCRRAGIPILYHGQIHTSSATSCGHKAALNWINKHWYWQPIEAPVSSFFILLFLFSFRSLSAHKLIPLQNAHVFSKDKLSTCVGMIHTDVMVSKVL